MTQALPSDGRDLRRSRPLASMNSAAAAEDGLSTRQKLAYGSGDLASNLVWGLLISFLMYYYTDIYGLPAAVAAWLLLVPRVLDAVCDPMFGYVVDRTAGRYVVPTMRFLAIPFGLLAFLCFWPLALPQTEKILWAGITYLLLGVVYSAINTPYGVLSNMMAVTSRERISLNTFRLGGCQLGQLLVAGAVLPGITWAGGGSGIAAQRVGITVVAAVVGAVSALLWLATSRGCRIRRQLPLEKHSLRTLFSILVVNRRWHLSNALTFLNFVVFCSEGGLAVHFTRLMLHHPARDASLMLACETAPAFIGVALTPMLTGRLGLRRTYLVLLAWQAACLLSMILFRNSYPLFLAVLALQFVAVGPVSPLCLSIVSEAVDEGRARTGVAAAGLAFSYNTLIGKLAAGIAGFLASSFLAFGHYTATLAAADADLAWWLTAGFIGIPLACVVLAAVLVFLSRADDTASSNASPMIPQEQM